MWWWSTTGRKIVQCLGGKSVLEEEMSVWESEEYSKTILSFGTERMCSGRSLRRWFLRSSLSMIWRNCSILSEDPIGSSLFVHFLRSSCHFLSSFFFSFSWCSSLIACFVVLAPFVVDMSWSSFPSVFSGWWKCPFSCWTSSEAKCLFINRWEKSMMKHLFTRWPTNYKGLKNDWGISSMVKTKWNLSWSCLCCFLVNSPLFEEMKGNLTMSVCDLLWRMYSLEDLSDLVEEIRHSLEEVRSFFSADRSSSQLFHTYQTKFLLLQTQLLNFCSSPLSTSFFPEQIFSPGKDSSIIGIDLGSRVINGDLETNIHFSIAFLFKSLVVVVVLLSVLPWFLFFLSFCSSPKKRSLSR